VHTPPSDGTGAAHARSSRSQDEHPLMGGDLEGGTAADEALRLLHLKAYADAAIRATGRAVLDIGCNDGYGTVLLSPDSPPTAGIDVSVEAIAVARRRPEATAIDFSVVDGGRLPFPDRSFELVTAFQVIEHIADVTPFIDEIRRVAAPGATIVFTTPNAALRIDPGMAPWNPFHVREYTADELRRALEPSFATVLVRGLFAPPPIAELEISRCAGARARARRPRPWPVRTVLRLLPPAARSWLRRAAGRARGAGDAAAIRGYTVDDLWYADEGLDAALDLQAICVTDGP
jgi:SAM-dependent methyltransferase